MNGVHDLGGLEGLGPVSPTPAEPQFHSEWERSVFTMLVPALLAGINLDEFRAGIERMHPVEYLASRYYEHWLHTIEHGLVEKGVITEAELAERTRYYAENPGAPLPDRQDPEQVKLLLDVLHAGATTKMEVDREPKYSSGQAVRVHNEHPSGHTRVARYLRGKRGTIDRVHDAFVFPDTNARREGENPQHVYSVRFDAAEVWGGQHPDQSQVIYFDLWEPYLQAV